MMMLVPSEESCSPTLTGAEALVEIGQQMAVMAEALRATHERMAALEAEVRRLKPVTPAQAGEIGRAIRERAAALCREYRAEGGEARAANAIRKAVKVTCGAQSLREISRCDYEIALRVVAMWDDYQVMKRIRGMRR